MNITAVVVTHNRLEFLKETIEALKSQTIPPKEIIVVDNDSSDGTDKWLSRQKGLTAIRQENLGSSGGQWRGFQEALKTGAEWIWTMDDDVVPEKTCLENLVKRASPDKIIVPLRIASDGKPFLNDVKRLNVSFPFKSLWLKIVDENDLRQELIEIEGATFEGPLFHRSVIEKIGLPEKNFFIHADDTEYFLRALEAGFKIYLATSARLNRKLPYADPDDGFTWKHYYVIRNVIAIDVLRGTLPVRILRPFAYLLKWLWRSRDISDVKTTFKAFADGYFYKPYNPSE